MAKRSTKKSRGGEVKFTPDVEELKLKCFDIPIYGTKIWFGLAENIKTLIESRLSPEDTLLDGAYCQSGYIEDKNGIRNYYIFLPYKYTSGDLGHEALHVVNHIFDRINVKDHSDEPANYLLGYLMDKFEKFANK